MAQSNCEISPRTLSILSVIPELVSAARNEETPLITNDMNKDVLLRKLQKSIHFEKTIAASNAPNYTKHCTMALPAWFVTRHGDKFRTSVLLRSGLSREPWRVELSLSYRSPCSRPEVKISGGWKTFATANGLVAGDSLIFSLRAMSEFDVYVFRENRSPSHISSNRAPRKQPCDFELSKEKVNTAVGSRHRNFVAERSEGRVIADIMEEGEAGTGSRVNETLQDRQGKIFFEKTLTAGAVSAKFQLTVPAMFVQRHGDKIGKHVVLQSVPDRKMWTVKVNAYIPRKHPQVLICGRTWKAFVVSNGLVKGDRLTFTLVAMSKFEVLILCSGGNPTAVHSAQGPVIRSKGSAFSQTWQPTKSLGPQHSDLTGKCSVKLERELSSELFAEKGAAEDGVAYSVSDSSQSPSDMDSHFFEQWCQRMSKKLCRQASTTQIAAPKAEMHFHTFSSE